MGWSNNPNPQEIYPSVVGRPKLIGDDAISGASIKDINVGQVAYDNRKFLDLKYPIQNGVVKDWEDTVHLWRHGFDQLKVKPAQTSILITEPVRNPDENKEKMAEIIFEKFGFGNMQIQYQAVLSAVAEGLTTACVLDSGDGVTHVVPIAENYILNNSIKRSNLAGKEVTKFLTKLLFLRGYAFNSSADFETVKDIKEKLGMMSHNIALDRKIANETVFYEQDYRLPDGSFVKVAIHSSSLEERDSRPQKYCSTPSWSTFPPIVSATWSLKLSEVVTLL